MGSLNSPSDFSYLYNFSFKSYGFQVQSYEEITLEYEFILPFTPEGPYTISHNIFYGVYDDDGKRDLYYSKNFYNNTLHLYRVEEETTYWTYFNLVKAIVSTIFVIFVTKTLLTDNEKKAKK